MKGPKTKSAIGQAQSLNSTLSLGKFDYHGDETTPPPAEVARGQCEISLCLRLL